VCVQSTKSFRLGFDRVVVGKTTCESVPKRKASAQTTRGGVRYGEREDEEMQKGCDRLEGQGGECLVASSSSVGA
jgi:hypothetical protein